MAASEATEVRFEIQLTEEDVAVANRLWMGRHRKSRFGLAACLFMALILGLFALFQGYSAGGIALFMALGAATYLLMIYAETLLGRRTARLCYEHRAGLRLPTHYVAGACGLAVAQVGFSAHFTWNQLLRWVEDDRHLLVFDSRETFLILPKRCLDDRAIQALRGFLDGASVPRV